MATSKQESGLVVPKRTAFNHNLMLDDLCKNLVKKYPHLFAEEIETIVQGWKEEILELECRIASHYKRFPQQYKA